VLTLCQKLQISAALSRALICPSALPCAHTLAGASDIRGAFPRLDMCSHFARRFRYSRRFPGNFIRALRFPSALRCAHTLPEDSDIRGAFPRLDMCSHFARSVRYPRRFPAPCDVLTLCPKIQIFAALFAPWYLPALCQKLQISARLSHRIDICSEGVKTVALSQQLDIFAGLFPVDSHVHRLSEKCDICTAL
jgi:hypothetical protein